MAKVEKRFLGKLTPEDVGGIARTMRFVLGNDVEVRASLDDFSPAMVERLALHGLSQKVGDAAASFSKERDYHGAFGAMQGVVDNLMQGVWSSRAGSSTADLVTAIAELQGVELEAAAEAVGKATEEQIATLRKHPAINARIKELQAARAKATAESADAEDLGKLFAELSR